MLFEQQQQQLQTPTINHLDGGSCTTANPLIFSSPDFFLLDDIDYYLPSVHSKKNNKNEYLLSRQISNENDINNKDHEQQQQEELFADLDFCTLENFDEKSELIDHAAIIEGWELEKWISQSAFPSPPMDTTQSPSSIEDSTSSTIPWVGEECTIQDMTVPLSPPFSTVGSSSPPPPPTKKTGKKPGLTITERKLRKKDQNKTAAEKYRIKKKSEKYSVFDRHGQLKTINRDLKLEAENLKFRIEQLKQLFVDLLQVQLPPTIESN